MPQRFIELHITAKSLGKPDSGDPAVLIAVEHIAAVQPTPQRTGAVVYLANHGSFPVVEAYEKIKALLVAVPQAAPVGRPDWTYNEPSAENLGALWKHKAERPGTPNDARAMVVGIAHHPADRMQDTLYVHRSAYSPLELTTRAEFLSRWEKP